MNDATIKCPKCGTEIELAKSMAGPMLDKIKADYEKQLNQMADTMEAQESLLRNKLTAEIEKTAVTKIQKEVKAKETEMLSELNRREDTISELVLLRDSQESKLRAAQQAQAEAAKKSRELDEQKRELDLTIEKRISEQLEITRFKARAEAEGLLSLKIAEREQTITSMQATIAELKQKSEQGSMQIQGEVQELELEKILRARFPFDVIAEVPKGINGADCVQEVKDTSGKLCGNIIWESKRTKSWSDGWLTKLRDDQRTAKADIAILVSQVLPKETAHFDLMDGVWVCKIETALPLATALRQVLLETALARGANEGVKSKTEMLYAYLTGLQFKQRVQAIVEAFTTMQEDLFREKKAITKSWAKREEQINNVMESTVGMYGDIQGIAGKAVKQIDGLEIRQIEKDSD